MERPDSVAARKSDRFFDRLSLAIILLVAFVALVTFRDYGITWDESYHLNYGWHILRFYGTGFGDHTAVTYRIDYLYGGGFDALGAIFRSWTRLFLNRYEAIHLFGSLIGVLGIAGTWRLGREVGGSRAGLIAVSIMATTAVYYGHMFNNPKDLPFAAGHAWGLYFLFRLIRAFPRIPKRLAIEAAAAIGLAMSVRIGGLLLFCYLALAVGWWCVWQMIRMRSLERGLQAARQLAPRIGLVVGGAWVVMLAWWPWALLDPIRRPLAALSRMSEFIDHRRYMPFAGEEVYNLDPPWDYLGHYFGLKLPEYLVILGVVATFGGLGLLLSGDRHRLHPKRQIVLWILGISFWFPPLWAMYKGSPLYDGLRHFLFLIPSLVAGVALLVDYFITRATHRFGRRGGFVAAGAFVILIGDQLSTIVALHPHQYVYFNRFIGGVSGAVGQYDTDYYAETFKDSAETLAQTLWRDEPEVYLNSVYSVGGCIGEFRAMRYLPDNFYFEIPKRELDFHIGYTRAGCSEKYPGSPVRTRVERLGATLNLARDLRVQTLPREEVARLRAVDAQAEAQKAKKANRKPRKPRKPKPKRPKKNRPSAVPSKNAPKPGAKPGPKPAGGGPQ